MKRPALLVTGILLLAGYHASFADTKEGKNGGIVYGENHSFMVRAPAGWFLDNSSRPEGLVAVVYPVGSSWDKSPARMYTNVVHKSNKENATLEKTINSDIEDFRKKAPEISITEGGLVNTYDGKSARIRNFLKDDYGNYESVAYIDEEKVIVLIVLSARSEAEWKKAFPSFRNFVGSYRYLTNEVNLQ
ncbi:MAG: hypothetical protein HYU99_04070 [Deltaproteobacteria bacterium]|nr:hypothetical protein [Deltaproteobacteria bacterium]